MTNMTTTTNLFIVSATSRKDCWELKRIVLPSSLFENYSPNTPGFIIALPYLIGLTYLFVGIALVSNTFVDSITKITSKTKKVVSKKAPCHHHPPPINNCTSKSASDVHCCKEEGGADEPEIEIVEVKVWNDSVANLTLMALGSSAPEIFLTVFEVIKDGYDAGELGPGSIVGSAAFNLLIITAVCIVSVPNGEGRPIEKIWVFMVTTSFSFFAYLWLLVILEFVSPNVVELWEAIVTVLFCPIMILVTWRTDKKWKKVPSSSGSGSAPQNTKQKEIDTLEGRDSVNDKNHCQRPWRSRFQEAIRVNGGKGKGTDDEKTEKVTKWDYLCHSVTVFWKVLVTFIPHPETMGGWPCFFISLGVIGLLTAFVEDLTTHFGCIIGLNDAITGMTLMAVGTSFPDTIVSRSSAINDKTADNAVGNVSGSNALNIFVGLGLPWLIAAIYHQLDGSHFKVPTASLTFSILIYTVVALMAMVLLALRRRLSLFHRVELGGPVGPKWASAACLGFLWFVYIALSSLQASQVLHFSLPSTSNSYR